MWCAAGDMIYFDLVQETNFKLPDYQRLITKKCKTKECTIWFDSFHLSKLKYYCTTTEHILSRKHILNHTWLVKPQSMEKEPFSTLTIIRNSIKHHLAFLLKIYPVFKSHSALERFFTNYFFFLSNDALDQSLHCCRFHNNHVWFVAQHKWIQCNNFMARKFSQYTKATQRGKKLVTLT